MQTAFYPHHTAKADDWSSTKPAPRHHLAAVTSHVGDWHYHGLPRPSRWSWLAILVSMTVHLGIFWGGLARPVRRATVVVKDSPVIQMEMPPLPEEEEEEPVEELDAPDEAPGIDVPRLMDLPSQVAITDFVQPLQVNLTPQVNMDGTKLTNIPTKIAPAGQRGSGIKNLFDISQLDRRPEAIAQPEPQFPHQFKTTVEQAEVVVEFIVDTKGITRDVRAISSTHQGFELAAVEGVLRWRFRPGMKDGRKVNTRTIVPIRFKIVNDS